MDFSDKNIFQMFVDNERRTGFWLTRTTWRNSCARVISVGDLTGLPPYYGNPKVLADILDRTTGEVKERGAKLSAPGTYKTWRQIDPPDWTS